MAVLKCKMCGGNVEFEQGATVGVCDSCGTRQTLPRIDDDRRNALLDRANHFRRNGEFDKAAALYEQLVTEGAADAEICWSLVLCRYGIQYVKDPKTGRQVPTVNRAQYTPVTADADYKQALAVADGEQRELYEAEAREIDEIQKGILEVSQKEEPFDVFICYKETDDAGRRTQDSVLANELYYALSEKGYKVFYARITLEDKLGSAYEPYIFAALNSAKVMVVLGTKPEYFKAVWVKNEWSRFLLLIKQGKKKMLIPAYRDMDPYDLPDEFATLQAQDMGKLGFVQDLVRGIEKITGATEQPRVNSALSAPAAAVSPEVSSTMSAMLDRGFLSLEDGEFEEADAFFENALNFDARCARAYFGKMMAAGKVRTPEDLNRSVADLEADKNYQKALRFSEEPFSAELRAYAERAAQNRLEKEQAEAYQKALDQLKAAKEQNRGDAYHMAAVLFAKTPGYKEADALSEQCREKARSIWYNGATQNERVGTSQLNAALLDRATQTFERLGDYKDAQERAQQCRVQQKKMPFYIRARHEAKQYALAKTVKQIDRILENLEKARGFRDADEKLAEWQKEKEKRAKRNHVLIGAGVIAAAALALTALVLILVFAVIRPAAFYRSGEKAMAAGDYATAYQQFSKTNRKDSKEKRQYAIDYVIENVSLQWQDGKEQEALDELAAVAPEECVTLWKEKQYGALIQKLKLSKFTIPNGAIGISEEGFSGCDTLVSITIPDSVRTIGAYAFSGCTGLTSVTIGNGVTSIGNYAFSGCTGLTSITIPNSITSIGAYTFSGCTGLTSITIPNSVTSIGAYAFAGCSNLKKIAYQGTAVQWRLVSKGGFWDIGTGNYTVQYTDN